MVPEANELRSGRRGCGRLNPRRKIPRIRRGEDTKEFRGRHVEWFDFRQRDPQRLFQAIDFPFAVESWNPVRHCADRPSPLNFSQLISNESPV